MILDLLKDEIIECILFQLEKGSLNEYRIFEIVNSCVDKPGSHKLFLKAMLDIYLKQMSDIGLIFATLENNERKYRLTKLGLHYFNYLNKFNKYRNNNLKSQ